MNDDTIREQMRERIESIVDQTLHGALYVFARQKGEAGGQEGEPDDRPFREIWDEFYRYIVIDGRVDSTIAIAQGVAVVSKKDQTTVEEREKH